MRQPYPGNSSPSYGARTDIITDTCVLSYHMNECALCENVSMYMYKCVLRVIIKRHSDTFVSLSHVHASKYLHALRRISSHKIYCGPDTNLLVVVPHFLHKRISVAGPESIYFL